jgi:transcription elongation factor GreA
MRYQDISETGLKALQKQLEDHKSEYSSLRDRLVELRQLKDVEDFDLIDETLRLNFLDKEIERVKDTIAHSKVLPAALKDGTVQIGSVVRLQPFDRGGSEMSCVLVSSVEADPLEGKISDRSPLGTALLGKMKDAIIKVAGPRKIFSYRIVGVDS